MKKYPILVVIVVSLILVGYVILLRTDSLPGLTGLIYGLSPFLMIWMVYSVIRYGKYDGPELDSDEEFGYQDKRKEDLGVF